MSMPAPAGAPGLRSRRIEDGLDVTFVPRADCLELHITLRPRPGDTPAALVDRLASVLREHRAAVVRHEIFGTLSARDAVLEALEASLGPLDWPVGWIEGNGRNRAGDVDGMHVFAVSGTPVETVRAGGRPVARAFDDAAARHALFHDIRPLQASRPPPDQARLGYEALEAALQDAGMDFSNVVRTWLFLDDILGWYGPLNIVRTDFYRERGVFDRLVPASTGVGGRNRSGAALAAAAWAVQPRNGSMRILEVASPLQCPAPRYGSSFSRAVEMASPDIRRLLISGTASIAPGGETLHAGDIDSQIALTMEVVGAILASRGMGFDDVTRGTVYYQDMKDRPHFDAWASAHQAPPLPLVSTPAYICRDDLLFEIEMDAMAPAL